MEAKRSADNSGAPSAVVVVVRVVATPRQNGVQSATSTVQGGGGQGKGGEFGAAER